VAVLLGGLAVAGAVVPAAPAGAYPSADVTLRGHGYGHGRGMGQWGALGYALAHTPWAAIVGHYYAPAAPAPRTPAQAAHQVSVVLTENNGSYTIVTSASGFTVAGRHFTAGQAVMLANNADRATYSAYAGGGCAGPWSPTPFASLANPTVVPDSDSLPGDPAAATKALQLCQPGGTLSVRGQLRATYNTGSPPAPRTVNIVPLESYISGVVPNESPAYWGGLGDAGGPQGQAWGFQELEAQAVATRSYVMAALGSYGGYADTCDLTCQTYRGLRNESPLSDAAVQATAGQVMELGGDGVPRTTEYSSSTGGYTAQGTFAPVPDTGDAVCVPGACNPHHTWSASIPVADIEATWPQLGTLTSVTVTGRTGLGAEGGRVTAMVLGGSSQSVTLTGDQFAAAMNLQSNWFAVTTTLSAPAVAIGGTPDARGYWMAGADGSVLAFGDAGFFGSASAAPLNSPVVGMAPTPTGRGYWLVAADGGIFTYGDAGFFGSAGALRLNRPIVGMAPTSDGRGYWLVASDGGVFSYGDASFYGSTGALRLNQPVVGMVPTPLGRGYWMVAADGGIFAFGDAGFFGSMGGLHLNRPIVGMTGVPGGTGYRMVASDGGIFSFGSAAFYGSAGSIALAQPIVGMAATSTGRGYWMVAADGGIFTYGDASFFGSGAA
jgi:SpoIID/LytB domain protein